MIPTLPQQVRQLAAAWSHYVATSPAGRHRAAMEQRRLYAAEHPRSDMRVAALQILDRDPQRWIAPQELVAPLTALGYEVRTSGIGQCLARAARAGQIEHRRISQARQEYRRGAGK